MGRKGLNTPVCIETKVPYALYIVLSTSPEIKQQDSKRTSAWFVSISAARYCLSRCIVPKSFLETLGEQSPDAMSTPFSISSWRLMPAKSGAQPSDDRMDEGGPEEYQSWGLPRQVRSRCWVCPTPDMP